MDPTVVAISTGHQGYPAESPYSPATRYPEYRIADGGLSASANAAYEGVRDALRLLGLDAGRFGAPDWNPLNEIIVPGDKVVLKPNFVRDFRETRPGHENCLITHGSIIRAVIDFVYLALNGRGRITIADAPQNDADFDRIRKIVRLDEIQAFYKANAGFDIEVYDLRPEKADKIDGVIVGHSRLPGDPAGYVKVNLGDHSAFAEIEDLCHLLYGSEYDKGELRHHQCEGTHEYLISKTILDADCVISLPKLKTHKKVGLTASMKNLVGINGNKNLLPHHREGTPAQGGDEFATDHVMHRVERVATATFKRCFPVLGPLRRILAGPIKTLGKRTFGDTNQGAIRSGNWHGNDTVWRMVIDLNRILRYADAGGQLQAVPQRKLFSVVDGVIGGDGNGPLDPVPKDAGVVIAGANPVAVDLACGRVMGFDYRRLPILLRSFDDHPLPLAAFGADDLTIVSDDARFTATDGSATQMSLGFTPHFGWRGHLESSSADPAMMRAKR